MVFHLFANNHVHLFGLKFILSKQEKHYFIYEDTWLCYKEDSCILNSLNPATVRCDQQEILYYSQI